jgi:hypothetical protein
LISTGPSKLSTLKLKQIYSNDNEKPQQQQQQQQLSAAATATSANCKFH